MESKKEIPLRSSPYEENGVRESLQPIAGVNTKTGDGGGSSHSITSEDDDDMPVRSTKRNRPVPIMLSSDDNVQQETSQSPVTPKKRSRPFQRYKQAGSSSSESDSEAPTARLRQKLSISPVSKQSSNGGPRTRARPSEAKRENQPSTPVVISDGSEETSSEEVVVTPVRRRKSAVQDQYSSRKADNKADSESSDDLQGELEDLRGTGTPLQSTRTRDGPIPSERGKRQQKLEELRRRRAGIREASQEEDDETDQDYQGYYDEIDEIDDVDYSEPQSVHHALQRGSNLDEYEEDFVDDEDDKVGVDLGVAGVPLEFTYHANKRPFEHFKTEIEWMVHNKLNPAFDRYDEMYQLAHRKLDKEVEGFVGSKFSSSVWGEDFTKALQARPDLDRVDVPTMLEHKCDACRRSNHPPKHKITFSGKPYNRDTLEVVEQDEDEDDTDDSDANKSSSTEGGESFFVGRFGFSCWYQFLIVIDIV